MLRAMAAASILLGSCHAFAQAPAPRPEFEVASIKLNKSGDRFIMIRPSRGGRLTVTNAPLKELITLAYRLKDFQLSGAPPWLASERYDIEAKAEGNPPFDQMLPMLQKLLEDRLQLKFHHETKEMPVYALEVAKAGKLHVSEGECGPPPQGPPPLPEPGKPLPKPCGGFFMFPGHISGQKVAMAQFLDILSRFTGRIVVDKTDLAGKYDVDLQYTPDPGQFPGGPPPPLPGGGPGPALPPVDPNGPSLFTALQEQLGLKLESQKAPVDITVVDHVERPSEN